MEILRKLLIKAQNDKHFKVYVAKFRNNDKRKQDILHYL